MSVCVCVLDCPQVQCVEQYVAIQADELNLEPTEIVNVIRKTNEGKSNCTCYSPQAHLNDLICNNGNLKKKNVKKSHELII